MGVNPPDDLTFFEDVQDAIAAARDDIEGDGVVNICRFPDNGNFCGNQSNPDGCPFCIKINAADILSNEYYAKIVTGGN